jgi:hypothetical protein
MWSDSSQISAPHESENVIHCSFPPLATRAIIAPFSSELLSISIPAHPNTLEILFEFSEYVTICQEKCENPCLTYFLWVLFAPLTIGSLNQSAKEFLEWLNEASDSDEDESDDD